MNLTYINSSVRKFISIIWKSLKYFSVAAVFYVLNVMWHIYPSLCSYYLWYFRFWHFSDHLNVYILASETIEI